MRLTAEQQRILGHRSGRVRIAAGAGTGKTHTLRLAISNLIATGVDPARVLCLTFTVEATNELRRRVIEEFAASPTVDAGELTVQTYHAFAAQIVRENALLLGLDGEPALLDTARAWQLALEALESCAFDGLEIGWLPSFVGKALELNEELQRHVVSPADVRAWCARADGGRVAAERAEALGLAEAYAALKRERNAIDFGDQIELAVRLLRERPEVLERLRARFRYLFLDEYQDTDVAQRELVRLVGGTAELVLAVGDVDQGIFGWRGATIHNMFAFPDDFPGAALETLSVNFRSGPRVLELANALIEPFERPRGERREPLKPVEGAPEAAVEGFVAPHQLDEAEEIARRIAAGCPPWSQYAVLSRTRGLFDPIFRALAARGIPVEVDTLGGFWTRPEVIDVVAWLRALADPGDNLALARLLLGPAYRLSRRDLFFLARHVKDENRRLRRGDRDLLPFALADAIVACDGIAELSLEARQRIAGFRATWRRLADVAARVSLADLVGGVARLSGLAAELAASPDPEAGLALRHLAKLRDLAQGYQPVAGSADLAGFVAYLDSVEEADQDEDELRAVEANAVRLMTLHRAKGLEWDVVFLPGLTEGHLPHPGKGGNNPVECWHRLPFELRGDREFLPPGPTQAGLNRLRDEEERRLLYVGATRARRRLVLSRAWYYRDNLQTKESSRFWDEAVRTGLVEVVECPRPETNPYPLGIEEPPVAQERVEVPAADPSEIAHLEAEYRRLVELEAARPRAARWRPPAAISVTALLTFLRDEEEFFWRYVRRRPAPPAPHARVGLELHRRIEQWARGASMPAVEVDEPYDLDASERRGAGRAVGPEELWRNFERSRFARMTPLAAEQPFTLYLGHGLSVEGRIDAVFEAAGGRWEVVDYKTGDPAHADPLQLALYGRAVEEIWGRDPVLTWFFLRDGREAAPEPVAGLAELLADAARRLRDFG